MYQRIYYKDTDAGGVVYHSRYVEFLEIARTEALRKVNSLVFKLMKKEKVIFPLTNLDIQYLKPAFYNDLLLIECNITKFSQLRINFTYQIYRFEDEQQVKKSLICKANTHHCSIDSAKLRPKRIDKNFFNLLKKDIEEYNNLF